MHHHSQRRRSPEAAAPNACCRAGRSIEAEARDILRSVLAGDEKALLPVPGNLGEAIRAIVEPLHGIELDVPPRKPVREPPKFE
ncbi:MAG: hypothetical protein ACLPWS_12395 [Rhodomicrobium sp.]